MSEETKDALAISKEETLTPEIDDKMQEKLDAISKTRDIINDDSFLLPEMGDFYLGAVDTEYLKILDKKINGTTDEDASARRTAFCADTPPVFKAETKYDAGQYGLFLEIKPEFTEDIRESGVLDGRTLICSIDAIYEKSGIKANRDAFEEYKKDILNQTKVSPNTYIKNKYIKFVINGLNVPSTSIWAVDHIHANNDTKTIKINGQDREARKLKDGTYKYLLKTGDVQQNVNAEKRLEELINKNNGVLYIFVDKSQLGKINQISNENDKDSAIDFSQIDKLNKALLHISQDFLNALKNDCQYSPADFDKYIKKETAFNFKNDKARNVNINPSKLFIGYFQNLGTESQVRETLNKFKDDNSVKPLIQIVNNNFESEKSPVTGVANIGLDIHTLSGTAYFQIDNKWFNAGKYLLTAPGDTEANVAEPNTENPYITNGYDIEDQKYVDAFNSIFDELDDRYRIQKQLLGQDKYLLNDWTVLLGDVLFMIPPESIMMQSTSSGETMPLLRAKNQMVKSNKDGRRVITLDTYFYGDKGINGFPYQDELPNGEKILYHMNGLRALISQFKFTPYLPIENNLLNNVFDIHAVMINSINIEKVKDIPRALKAQIILTEFDYNTYMPEITDLMVTLGISEKDRNYFSSSINWKVFRYYYQRALINGNELSVKNFDFNSYQYTKEHLKNHTILQPMKFHNSTLRMYIADEDYLDMMMDQRMEDIFGVDRNLKPKNKEQWDELGRIGELGDAIAKAAASSEWNKALKEYAEANTDIDLIKKPQQFQTTKAEFKNLENPSKNILPKLKDTLMNLDFKNKDDIKDITYSSNQVFTDSKTHDTMLCRISLDIHLDKNKYQNYLKNDNNVISVAYTAKYELVDDNNHSYKRVSDFVLDTTTQSSNLLSTADRYTTQKKYTDFDMGELETSNDGDWQQATNIFNYSLLKYVEVNLPDLIVTNFQTIFQNNFSNTATLNASGPCCQYMSGDSIQFNVQMTTNNKETASYLSRLSRTINLYEKKYRMILPCYPLKIESDFTKLIDINDVIPHSIDVQTVNGVPGWYDINITFISVDKTLRQREAMSAIEGINSGWKENSWFQDEYKDTNMANFEMLKQVMGQVEVYPDLELPKISELEKLGFKFTRYLFQDDRIYVDPDFYFVYLAPLNSQVLRETVLKLIKPDGLLNGDQTITDESGAQFDLIAKDGLGTSVQNMNDVAKEQQSQMNDAKEASKKIALKKLNENLKQAAHQKGQESNLDAWEVCKDIKTIFLERKYDKELKSNIARKKADAVLADNGPDSKIKAPNGKFFKQNDIDYLIKNKYTQEQAIALLSKIDKYTKPVEVDTNNSLEKHNTESNKLEIQKPIDIKQAKDIFGKTKEPKKESQENQDNKDATTSAHVQAEIQKEGRKITEGEWVNEQITKSLSAANDFLYYLENTPITLKKTDVINSEKDEDGKLLEKGKDWLKIQHTSLKEQIYAYTKYWFEFDATRALCEALYINVNDNFLSVVSDIIYSAACNATADKEYSSKQKATDWKPNPNFIAVINGLSQDASERQEALTISEGVENGLEFGPFRFKMYSQDTVNAITGEQNINVSSDNNKNKINSAMFVLDPYYRRHKDEVEQYKLNCIVNGKYATIAYLRLVFYWLARLTQEYVYPSINSDVLRKTSVTELDIQHQYKKSGVSDNVDEQLLKNIEFFKKNEYQIDSGKIFVANLLTACDGDSKLLSRIKAKEYNALSSYQKGCVIPGKTVNPNETSAMVFRKTIMALAGVGRIKDINTMGVSQDKIVNKIVNTIYEKKYIEAAENVTTYASHACHDMIVYDARGRMLRAFPTFYMMLIDEGRDVGKWHLHDNYYNNNALGSIVVTRSKDNPVDVAEITMSNFYGSFLLTGDDSFYSNTPDISLMDAFADIVTPIVIPSEQKKLEERERKIKDMKPALRLVPGTKLTVKLGYGANPNLMPTVFNGVIAEVSAEDEVVLECSGYGQELINPILEDMEAYHLPRQDDLIGAFANTESPINIVRGLFTQRGGFLKKLGSHIPIISDYIDRNAFGITNFGNPDFTDIFKSGEPCQNIFSVTAPNKISDDGEIVADGQQIQISFDVFGRSPWDVIHIAKSLNPDALAGIRNFGLRQTVFMGMNRYYYAYDYARDKNTNTIVEKRKPFQQFHIYNSYQDIIQNGWATSTKDMHTVAVGLYQNSGSFNSVSQEKIGPLYADIDIYPDIQKTMTYDTGLITKGIPYVGTITNSLFNNEYVEDFLKMFDIFDIQDEKGMVNNNQDIAWRMTASGLRQAVARMYTGDIVVIGDPSVNPLDRIYVYDEVNGIRGQAIVAEVSHMITQEGFTTVISPECIVTVDDKFENATHSIFHNLTNIAMFTVAATHSMCVLKDSFKNVRTQAKEYWSKNNMNEKTFSGKAEKIKDDFLKFGKEATSAKKEILAKKFNFVRKTNLKMKSKIAKRAASNVFKTFGKKIAGTVLKAVPFLGEILFAAEFAMIRFNRFAKNLQVVQMYPLQKYGLPWTAGVNGQKGMVYGSRTGNQQGLLEEAINTVFGSGDKDNAFAKGLKEFLIPPELIETADKYEANGNKDTEQAIDNAGKTTDEYDKYKSSNRFANKVKGIMASTNGTNEQKTLSKTDYRQMQINQRANYDDPESIKASYDYFNMDTDKNWLANNKLKRNRLISKDVRLNPYIKEGFFKIIHETPGLNEGKYVKTSNVRFDGQDAYIKQIVETRQDGKIILDVPMLNPEALNILFELIRRAKNNMPAANASDPYENYEETKTSFIALESALRIADDKSVAGAGYTFILHGVDKAAPALAKAIKEFHDEIELDAKDNKSLNPVIFDSKDLGNNKTVISCRFPLVVQPKEWDDNGDMISTNPEAENKINKDKIGEQAKEERPSEIKKLKFDMEDMDGTSGLGLHQDIEESLLKLLK